MNHFTPFQEYIIHNAGYSQFSGPIIKSANGSFLFSENGEKYFDPSLGAGSQIFGHANSEVIRSINKQIKDGSIYQWNNSMVHSFSRSLQKVLPDGQNHYVFCNSGSEATQRALRLARVATGRDIIACFKGGWHGINEWTLADHGDRFDRNISHKKDGIPEFLKNNRLILPYNDRRAFKLIEENSKNLAGIIVEPVQGSNPRNDILPFLKKIEAICKKNKILFILDEIITGFRLGLGGATKLWALNPDIITYGKIIGGGLPIGLVTCSNDVAAESFNDPEKQIYAGGTFSANPLVSAAGSSMISQLLKADYTLIDDLGRLMRRRLNTLFQELDLPFSVIGIRSISRLAFTNKTFRNRAERDKLESSATVQKKFYSEMLSQKVLWPANGILFNGFCHTKKQIDDFCCKVIGAAKKSITQ